ncbi:DUF721 domain-containing protein [Dissulfurirhabdus thermomarina]|uniref:DciA family protein n=1 Tax=Dissulfurirhabdus thermomarina TaxID=1765737 RepID=UPI00146FEEEA|nr:DUF721 domain-containing protein [Dissulfurirhabdus thermomarina]
MRGRYRSMSALSEVLRHSLGAERAWRERLQRGRVWEVWEAAVGPGVAAHAWPEGFRERDVLVVVVSDSVWMQQLHLQRLLVLQRLNAHLEEAPIREIRFRLGDVEGERRKWTRRAGTAARRPAALPPPSREDLEAAERLVAELPDGDLRRAFRELFLLDRRAHRAGREGEEGGA